MRLGADSEGKGEKSSGEGGVTGPMLPVAVHRQHELAGLEDHPVYYLQVQWLMPQRQTQGSPSWRELVPPMPPTAQGFPRSPGGGQHGRPWQPTAPHGSPPRRHRPRRWPLGRAH